MKKNDDEREGSGMAVQLGWLVSLMESYCYV